MKNYLSKIIATCFLATSLFSVSAFAKTEGLSLGFGVTKNSVDYKNAPILIDGAGDTTRLVGSTVSDSSNGYAFNLKYAFPDIIVDGLYLAPSIFYESINSSATDESKEGLTLALTSRDGLSYSIGGRHGVKVDLGYDILDELAAYVTLGVAVVDYEINAAYVNGISLPGQRVDGKNSSAIYGFGLNYNIKEDLALNFEYNRQQLSLSGMATNGDQSFNNVVGTRIESMQIGISSKF